MSNLCQNFHDFNSWMTENIPSLYEALHMCETKITQELILNSVNNSIVLK